MKPLIPPHEKRCITELLVRVEELSPRINVFHEFGVGKFSATIIKDSKVGLLSVIADSSYMSDEEINRAIKDFQKELVELVERLSREVA